MNLKNVQTATMSNEDALPTSYKYAWSEKSDGTLQDFLTKVSLQHLTGSLNSELLLLISIFISSNHQWFRMMELNLYVACYCESLLPKI